MIEFSKLSDDDLLVAARRQPDAFGAFYERHARAVLAFLVGMTGDRDLALDLTAEVFAAALASVGRYRPGEAPAMSWVIGIAQKKVAETRRGRARAFAARRKLNMPRLAFTDADIERVEEILDAERTGYMGRMADLSADERHAVTARVIDERDYSDVAAAVGTSEATIRKRVSRGLAKLAHRETGGI